MGQKANHRINTCTNTSPSDRSIMAKAFDFDRLIDQLAQGRNEEIEVQSCKQLSFALGTGIRRLKKREIELNEIQRESRANIKELQDKRSRIEQLEGIVTDKKRVRGISAQSILYIANFVS